MVSSTSPHECVAGVSVSACAWMRGGLRSRGGGGSGPAQNSTVTSPSLELDFFFPDWVEGTPREVRRSQIALSFPAYQIENQNSPP